MSVYCAAVGCHSPHIGAVLKASGTMVVPLGRLNGMLAGGVGDARRASIAAALGQGGLACLRLQCCFFVLENNLWLVASNTL